MSDPSPFISARGLRKEYAGVVALSDVDLDVAEGEIIGLVGKNGAGKSTLIKILAGAVQPDAGEVRIDGELVHLHNPHQAHLLGVSFMHQELEQVPGMSVAENLVLGARMERRARVFVNWQRLYATASEVLKDLDPRIDPRVPIDSLSVAQKRLVMIGRALYHRARLVMLDEPTASLTTEEIDNLHTICRRLKQLGSSVLYVSHRLDEVGELTDRVVTMRDGKVVLAARTNELSHRELVMAITGASSGQTAVERRIQHRVGGRPEGPELLRVEGITREGVLDRISFDLRGGEILGMAGLVGAGRTELVRMIFGADRFASGAIFVDGKQVQIRSPRDAMEHGIALLPEDRRHQAMVLDFGIRENVTLTSLRRYRMVGTPFPSKRRERVAVRAVIDRLAMKAASVDQPVRHLSGGTQQKVVLGRWLEHGSRIVIFDEPTAGIDVEAKEEIYRLMEQLAEAGSGLIFISSDFAELVAVCHRVIVLQEGRLVGEVEGGDITESNIVDLCYAAMPRTA